MHQQSTIPSSQGFTEKQLEQLEHFYNKAFDAKFPAAFEKAFTPAFDKAFERSFEPAFSKAFNRSFPAAFEKAFTPAFDKAFAPAFDKATHTPEFGKRIYTIVSDAIVDAMDSVYLPGIQRMLDESSDKMCARIHTMDEKMGMLARRTEGIEHIMDSHEKRLEGIDHTLKSVDDRLDYLTVRVNEIQEVLPKKEKFPWKIPQAFQVAERRWGYSAPSGEEKKKETEK